MSRFYLTDLSFVLNFDGEEKKWSDLKEEKKAEFVKSLLSDRERLKEENAYLKRLNLAQATKQDPGDRSEY